MILRKYLDEHISLLQRRITLLNEKMKHSTQTEWIADYREKKTLCDERDELKRLIMRADEMQEYK